MRSRAEASMMRALSKSMLSKLMERLISSRTPTTMNFSPIIVTIWPTVLLMVLKRARESVWPRTTEWASFWPVRKAP